MTFKLFIFLCKVQVQNNTSTLHKSTLDYMFDIVLLVNICWSMLFRRTLLW